MFFKFVYLYNKKRKKNSHTYQEPKFAITAYNVMMQYMDQEYEDKESLTVAPDIHVCKATYQLGLITKEEFNSSHVQQIVRERWKAVLKDTKYHPIDVHITLWLWSRNGFLELKEE